MWPTAIITICKYLIGSWWCVNRSVLCPSGPLVKSKSQVYLCASYEYLTLGYSITRLESQNRKFAPIFITTGPKNDHFFVCKNDSDSSLGSLIVTWVESFCKKRDSSRIESPSFSTWLESSQSHQKSWLESSYWLESRYHWFISALATQLASS